jgi:hypothetical protein
MFDYNMIYNALRGGVATITFNKLDGTERVMRCTLKDDYLPEQYRGKGAMLTEGGNTMRVYDLDLNEWRSFRVDTVTGLRYNNPGVQKLLTE